jgi:uncharacterized membrane protein
MDPQTAGSSAHSRQVPRVIHQNIATLVAAKDEVDRSRGLQDHLADVITAFSGTMTFVYMHLIWFMVWLTWNLVLAPDQAFDPYPFGMLTTIVSLEAIFLSTFVLITQNRQAHIADRRADLDIQVNLLAEHEITRLLRLSHAIAKRLNVEAEDVGELQELKQDVEPRVVLEQLKTGSNSPPTGAESQPKSH